MIPSAPLGTDATADRPLGLGADGGSPARPWSSAGEAAVPSGGAAERRFRFELAAHPGSPAQARRLTRARLTGWSVCEDTCDSAALVVSELVTNAIVHTASDVVVCELHDGGDLVRIAVRDQGCAPGEPCPSPQRPDEEHGRGLLLVDALSHAWGAQEQGPGGLLVWAELPRQAEAPGRDRAPHADLGWGARPKPTRSDGGTGEEDEAEAQDLLADDERGRRIPAPPQGRTPAPHGHTPGPAHVRTHAAPHGRGTPEHSTARPDPHHRTGAPGVPPSGRGRAWGTV
ncbi:ATP-binding protein [Streptomyces glaucescens]|uniref:Regulatory protein n=1 Tax=Streptomyces glaucescens TaxID=1907 RepID=A0A089X1Z8_STRGA|nr:ATP-binding protein [Streptomyces glaucescens]AIR97802.1 regulatory protein [Streptomyces glaucescens]